MTPTAPRLDRRGRAALQAERRRLWAQAEPEAGAWHAGSGLLSGVLLMGGAGWLLARWLGWTWLVPVGVLLGMGAGLTSLWFRYGVARPTGGAPPRAVDGDGPPDRAGGREHRPAPTVSPTDSTDAPRPREDP